MMFTGKIKCHSKSMEWHYQWNGTQNKFEEIMIARILRWDNVLAHIPSQSQKL